MMNDSDRELTRLALAALNKGFSLEGSNWNPLKDNGTAFKLALDLGIAVIPYPIYSRPKHSVIAKQYSESVKSYRGEPDATIEEVEIYGDDEDAATRRAIVKVAAQIGRRTPTKGKDEA
jgi:hypothetical protein